MQVVLLMKTNFILLQIQKMEINIFYQDMFLMAAIALIFSQF